MKKMKISSLPLALRIGLVLVILGVLFTGFNLAKYVTEDSQTNAFVAKNFYFESDLLDGSAYTLPAGTAQLDVSLMNYADALRKSEVAISYQVTLYKDDVKVAGYPKSGTLAVNDADGVAKETFTLSGEGTYRVEVQATGPYTKTLPATTFVVPPQETELDWRVEDGEGSAVCYLVISVGDYDGGILVTTPGAANVQLNPNETVPATVSAYTEYRLTYFKENVGQVYTKENFSVTKN